MSESIGHKAASGAIWATIDRFGYMTLQFIVNLILARLLMPEDFGAIGMLAIFITVSQVLIDGGFGSALIQKKKPTQIDYSTIFYWNIFFSGCLYLILFVTAPYIAKFFSIPILSGVLRVIGSTLIINSIFSIQKFRLQKLLEFKRIAISNLSSYIIGAASAIALAYHGFGVWSLVSMQIIYGIVFIVVLWVITKWHPSLCFSLSSMKELFGFGGYMLAANILQTICQNIQGIIIGKNFSATQMGYYTQASKLDYITSYSIPQVIVQVMYPVYSSIQDDRARLNEIVVMNLRVISFLVFPILGILILVAKILIIFLYGEIWAQSVPYFQVLCIGGFFVCLQNINFYAVAAVGKSRQLFVWSFYKWGFLLCALLIGMNFGMFGILWGMVISNINICFINAYLASKHTKLSIYTQIRAILPILLVTAISISIGYCACKIHVHIILSCILIVFTYTAISYKFRLKAMEDTKLAFLKLLNR